MNKTIRLILLFVAVVACAVTLLMCGSGCAPLGRLFTPETNAVTGVVTLVPGTNVVATLEATKTAVNAFAPGLGNLVYAAGAGILGLIGGIYGRKLTGKK